MEILLGFVTVGFYTSTWMEIGTLYAFTYVIFWLFEQLGILQDNPAEYFLHSIIEWFETLALLDFVRVPLIYFEFIIVKLTNYYAQKQNKTKLIEPMKEFDVNNPYLQAAFLNIASPFVWLFIFQLMPFLQYYMPIVLIAYYYDKSIFQREVNIWVEHPDAKEPREVLEDDTIHRTKENITIA